MEEIKKINWIKFIIVFILLILIFIILYFSQRVLVVFITSLTLAYILTPPVLYLERRKVPRAIGILLSYIALGVVLTIILLFIVNPLSEQINILGDNLPKYIGQVKEILVSAQSNYLHGLPENWNKIITDEFENITKSVIIWLRKGGVELTVKVFSYIIDLFFIPILTFYFILDREKIRDFLISLFPQKYQVEGGEILLEINRAINGYIKGQLLLCFILGIGATILFYILGLDFALLCGIFAGIFKAIPIIGQIIGIIPAFFLALIKSFKLALWIALIFSILQFIENKLVLPLIMEHFVHLHPITIIIALLIGESLGGLLGMFIAVPIASIIKILYIHFYPKLLS